MNQVNNSIQVVNTLTGEVTQFSYSNIDQLKNQYLELDTMIATFERAKKKMKADLEFALGEDELIRFDDGYALKKQHRSVYTYDKSTVAKYLDDDQLDVVSKIDNTALKALFAELTKRGEAPAGAWADIEASATVKHSEFIQLLKSV